nr:uncharacterized protein LOC110358557 isoform X2 [Columba livia]
METAQEQPWLSQLLLCVSEKLEAAASPPARTSRCCKHMLQPLSLQKVINLLRAEEAQDGQERKPRQAASCWRIRSGRDALGSAQLGLVPLPAPRLCQNNLLLPSSGSARKAQKWTWGAKAFSVLPKDHNLCSAPPEQRLKVTEQTRPLDLPSTSASSAGKWMQQSKRIGRKKGQDKSSERAQQGLTNEFASPCCRLKTARVCSWALISFKGLEVQPELNGRFRPTPLQALSSAAKPHARLLKPETPLQRPNSSLSF